MKRVLPLVAVLLLAAGCPSPSGGQDVTLTADGPGQKVILPVWGPEWHGGSTFKYPGAEFGAGFTFPAAGCWRIRVVNESGVGELTLRIAPAATPSASHTSR